MASDDNTINLVTAAFVIIGNEILSGRTKDANLSFLASELSNIGIRLEEVRIIKDDHVTIAETVKIIRKQYDYVFTSGGIGPTHDDITCDSIAQSFNLEVYHHPDAVQRMSDHARKRNVELNEARMRMARTPKGATLILNPISAAPGFTVENVHVMAGVPSVFQAMVKELLPTLKTGTKVHSVTVICNLGEGLIAKGLEEIQIQKPNIDIGSYPYFRSGVYGTELVLRGTDIKDIEASAESIRQLIIKNCGHPTNEKGYK